MVKLSDLRAKAAKVSAAATDTLLAVPADLTSSFSDADVRQMRQLFAFYDTDGSGAIDGDELTAALTKIDGEAPSAQRVAQLMAEADEDGSGSIDFGEFLRVVVGNAMSPEPSGFSHVVAKGQQASAAPPSPRDGPDNSLGGGGLYSSPSFSFTPGPTLASGSTARRVSFLSPDSEASGVSGASGTKKSRSGAASAWGLMSPDESPESPPTRSEVKAISPAVRPETKVASPLLARLMRNSEAKVATPMWPAEEKEVEEEDEEEARGRLLSPTMALFGAKKNVAAKPADQPTAAAASSPPARAESKVASQPARSEAKAALSKLMTEAKSDAKAEAKAETKAEVKSEVIPVAKPEAKVSALSAPSPKPTASSGIAVAGGAAKPSNFAMKLGSAQKNTFGQGSRFGASSAPALSGSSLRYRKVEVNTMFGLSPPPSQPSTPSTLAAPETPADKALEAATKGLKPVPGFRARGMVAPADLDLTDSQVGRYRELFGFYDSDSSGSIDQAELAQVLAKLGDEVSTEKVAELMKEADSDGSGDIDFGEFCRVMCKARDKGVGFFAVVADNVDKKVNPFKVGDEVTLTQGGVRVRGKLKKRAGMFWTVELSDGQEVAGIALSCLSRPSPLDDLEQPTPGKSPCATHDSPRHQSPSKFVLTDTLSPVGASLFKGEASAGSPSAPVQPRPRAPKLVSTPVVELSSPLEYDAEEQAPAEAKSATVVPASSGAKVAKRITDSGIKSAKSGGPPPLYPLGARPEEPVEVKIAPSTPAAPQTPADKALEAATKGLKPVLAWRARGMVAPADLNLTDSQVGRYRELFGFYDSDSSGSIDQAELAQVLAKLGDEVSTEKVAELMKEADSDGSGDIDFGEFCRVMCEARDKGVGFFAVMADKVDMNVAGAAKIAEISGAQTTTSILNSGAKTASSVGPVSLRSLARPDRRLVVDTSKSAPTSENSPPPLPPLSPEGPVDGPSPSAELPSPHVLRKRMTIRSGGAGGVVLPGKGSGNALNRMSALGGSMSGFFQDLATDAEREKVAAATKAEQTSMIYSGIKSPQPRPRSPEPEQSVRLPKPSSLPSSDWRPPTTTSFAAPPESGSGKPRQPREDRDRCMAALVVPDSLRLSLTAAQVDKYKELFTFFDADGSGAIDREEVRHLLSAVGDADLTEAHLDYVINEVDVDKNGVIDFGEFCSLMARVENGELPSIASPLKVFDAVALMHKGGRAVEANPVNYSSSSFMKADLGVKPDSAFLERQRAAARSAGLMQGWEQRIKERHLKVGEDNTDALKGLTEKELVMIAMTPMQFADKPPPEPEDDDIPEKAWWKRENYHLKTVNWGGRDITKERSSPTTPGASPEPATGDRVYLSSPGVSANPSITRFATPRDAIPPPEPLGASSHSIQEFFSARYGSDGPRPRDVSPEQRRSDEQALKALGDDQRNVNPDKKRHLAALFPGASIRCSPNGMVVITPSSSFSMRGSDGAPRHASPSSRDKSPQCGGRRHRDASPQSGARSRSHSPLSPLSPVVEATADSRIRLEALMRRLSSGEQKEPGRSVDGAPRAPRQKTTVDLSLDLAAETSATPARTPAREAGPAATLTPEGQAKSGFKAAMAAKAAEVAARTGPSPALEAAESSSVTPAGPQVASKRLSWAQHVSEGAESNADGEDEYGRLTDDESDDYPDEESEEGGPFVGHLTPSLMAPGYAPAQSPIPHGARGTPEPSPEPSPVERRLQAGRGQSLITNMIHLSIDDSGGRANLKVDDYYDESGRYRKQSTAGASEAARLSAAKKSAPSPVAAISPRLSPLFSPRVSGALGGFLSSFTMDLSLPMGCALAITGRVVVVEQRGQAALGGVQKGMYVVGVGKYKTKTLADVQLALNKERARRERRVERALRRAAEANAAAQLVSVHDSAEGSAGKDGTTASQVKSAEGVTAREAVTARLASLGLTAPMSAAVRGSLSGFKSGRKPDNFDEEASSVKAVAGDDDASAEAGRAAKVAHEAAAKANASRFVVVVLQGTGPPASSDASSVASPIATRHGASTGPSSEPGRHSPDAIESYYAVR